MKAIKKMKPLSNPLVEESASAPTPKFTDLRQVMDYTRPLSIFYSGVEYESYLEILYDLGIRNFLMSYEYLKGKGLSQLKKYPDIHLFVDSGAYTYQNDPKYENYTLEQWEEQIVTYLNWAKKYKNQIFAIADLDLQYLDSVGYEKVYEWRKKYFEPFMLETGIPVCFIYHEDGLDYWDYMCKRYPYVGLSLAIDKAENGTEQLREMFRIAEKHNALCQGMASTNTAMLTQYPFYTVDSTTWNVGLKYGEISVWTGTKMTRIKKEDFETKAFPFIAKYKQKFDFNLILEEDKTEMIRVNAQAFVEAEQFVRERLKSKMYWFKKRAVKIDVDNLPEDFFPDITWFTGSHSDIAEVAQKMNINPEYSEAFQTVCDMTVFLNWGDPYYKPLQLEYEENDYKLVNDIHEIYVNRIVPDVETRLEDLKKFFRECLSGENDRLLQMGTNFDRIVKEREEYIDDTEEELVDLSEEELKVKLHGLLPSPADATGEAPEVTALDEEVYRQVGIVPTFDEKGRFVKGQKAVRKPKKVYSTKYPKFACDTCYAAQRCPEFKAGYVCAYQKMFNRFDTRDMADIIQALQGMVEHNMTRMQRAMVMEVLNGTIDPQVTGFIDQNMRLMTMLKQMYEFGSPEVLRQTRIVRADGSREETTQITNPQGGGILERLFGNLTEPKKDDTIIEAEVVSEPPKKNARYENIEED